MLFNLFINDISPSLYDCKRLLYVDGMNLFTKVKSSLDCVELKLAISATQKWSTQNGLLLNSSKCKSISFHRSLNSINFQYYIGLEQLEKVKI